jgi:hypothetical protein
MSVSSRSMIQIISCWFVITNVQVRTGSVVLSVEVDKVALGQVLLLWLHFYCQYQNIVIFIYVLRVPEGQTVLSLRPCKESSALPEMRERWTEIHLHVFQSSTL